MIERVRQGSWKWIGPQSGERMATGGCCWRGRCCWETVRDRASLSGVSRSNLGSVHVTKLASNWGAASTPVLNLERLTSKQTINQSTSPRPRHDILSISTSCKQQNIHSHTATPPETLN